MKRRRRRGRPGWWRWIAPGFVLSACVGFPERATAQSREPDELAPSAGYEIALEKTPSSLEDAGQFAENVYDYAKAADWKNAAFELMSLREAVKRVRVDVDNQSDVIAALGGHALALNRAVTDNNRWVSMCEANQVTLAVADMTATYKSSVPIELTKLDYYARELEIWAEAHDTTRLQTATFQMVREGNRLRLALNARSAIEAQRVGDLLAQSEGAETSADYAQLSKSVREEVAVVKGLFPR